MKIKSNGNRYWLKQHQITAFWHGFGISNGLQIPGEHVTLRHYKRKPYYEIDPAYMQRKLAEYVSWLEQYKTSWNKDTGHPFGITTRREFIDDEKSHASRRDILTMIELLQECRIDDK